MKSQEEKELSTQLEQVRGRLDDLAAELRVVDDEAESLAPQRKQHELLEQACGSLEKLGELGAASLFWGDRIEPAHVEEQLRGVRSRVDAFQAQLDELDARRNSILSRIAREEENHEIVCGDLYEFRVEEERRKEEWITERDISPVPRRVQLMAWARGGEDDRRFRKTLAASLLISLILGLVIPMIRLPLPRHFVPEDVPRRLAQLVRQAQAKPLPPPAVVETPPEEVPPEETPKEQQEPEPTEEPNPTAQPDPAAPEAQANSAPSPGPQKRIAKAGILAFKDKFASLAKDDVAPRLGSAARYGDADDVSGPTTRNMLTTNVPGSSGGINIGSLSRNTGGRGGGGGGGGAMHGVQVGRATSSIASIGGGGRPLARGGAGPSRTDEEIQIVFDRYKASFYRLYNRELRKDPTLRGQMVLRLTIEPDGSVSMCKLQSSDMEAPDLAAQVVNRVLTINFGAKEGVKALTIVYPIDFLPAGEAD